MSQERQWHGAAKALAALAEALPVGEVVEAASMGRISWALDALNKGSEPTADFLRSRAGGPFFARYHAEHLV